MKLQLTGLRKLEIVASESSKSLDGRKPLRVLYCAICRTDAKIWSEGHRDLSLPRVPGHELVAADNHGKRFAVWPGTSCGKCRYCQNGRENLCEDMKIMGFHHDGGFSHHVTAPPQNLIPVPHGIPSHIATFAEPVGCVFNALARLEPQKGERMIIYGGGVLGLIAASAVREQGATPLIIEKNEEKIAKSKAFLEKAGVLCIKDTPESEFDLALNACADPGAFSRCLTKLKKGGRICYFSGITKNQSLETNLLNLMHYKEVHLSGAYGLTREQMKSALSFILNKVAFFHDLIEEIIPPTKTPEILPQVLSGNTLRYVLDFENSLASPTPESPAPSASIHKRGGTKGPVFTGESGFGARIQSIRPVSDRLKPEALHKIDNKTKPLGSLGKLESLALQASLVQENLNPALNRKALFVFAGDHGITEEGVSAFPSEVTGQMVENFLKGGAAINILCRHHAIDLYVADMGVNGDFEEHPALFRKKIRKGTRNFALEEAMTAQEVKEALSKGMDVFLKENARKRIDIVGLGEMGIGNTTSASAIISVVTGIPAGETTGRGTGLDDKAMAHKTEIISNALKYHSPNPCDGMDILRKIGGYEIAGIAGAALVAASEGTIIVLDGVISTAGGLIAYLLNPHVKGYLVSGHRSVEIAQQAALSHMGLEPVIDYQMRLGEGTGAAFTINTVDAACRIMREMASFDDAGVAREHLTRANG